MRVLLPPVDMPVQSSRLIQISGPLSALLKFGRYSSGVGRCAKRILGNRARFIVCSQLKGRIDVRTQVLLHALMFSAILVERDPPPYRASLKKFDESQLPPGDVTVRVEYSTLNYKDALAITGKGPVVRHFPMVPGIDLAGTVDESSNTSYKSGDKVLLNGWGVGESHWGGLAQRARVKADWLIPLPGALTARQAMAVGTAGYTAMLSVMALERHGITPGDGEILVTGAAGGVGSVAVALLSKLGFRVAAMTGRPAESDFLRQLGAAEILDRAAYSGSGQAVGQRALGRGDRRGRQPYLGQRLRVAALWRCGRCLRLGRQAWIFQRRSHRSYCAALPWRASTVSCVRAPDRVEAWRRLSRDLEVHKLELLAQEISLAQALERAGSVLEGRVRGRIIVDVNR